MGDTPAGMYALVIVMSLLAIIATGLRFQARFLKKNGISYDDYAILAALIFTIATGICIIVGAAIGDLARHTMIDPNDYPIFTRRTQVFEQVGRH